MKINGVAISKKIKEELRQKVSGCDKNPSVDLVCIGEDPVIESFVKRKIIFGEKIGIEVKRHQLSSNISQESAEEEIKKIIEGSMACVIQLPLPKHMDTQKLLDLVPADKDIDVLGSPAIEKFKSGKSMFVPPVVGAIQEILMSENIDLQDKKIAVIGAGKLVGKPIMIWLDNIGADYSLIDMSISAEDRKTQLTKVDIVISGIGQPNNIKKDEIKYGAILLDAGTSEVSKKIIGDIDPECYEQALFYTPVPGGIGPITISVLFRNLVNYICN